MRVRMRFTKQGKIRWTSHRDVARMWERAFRRAQLPVAKTEGFTPRLKVSFGLALPTGHESLAEYLDVELAAPVDVATLPARLSPLLPTGLDVVAAQALTGPTPSLQEDVTSSTWQIEAVGAVPEEVEAMVAALLAAEHAVITRQRKGSEQDEDVRPAIVSVTVDGPVVCESDDHSPGAVLVAELAAQPRSLRPAELLAALCWGTPRLDEGHVRRLNQWTSRDGARREPLPLDATDAPHAKERAS